MIERGDWQVSEIARNAFDLEHKVVGTIGAGRIGYRVMQRLVPFNCKELLYYDYTALPAGEYPIHPPARNVIEEDTHTQTKNPSPPRGRENRWRAQGHRPS